MPFAIKSTRVVRPGGIGPATIVVHDGRIESVKKHSEPAAVADVLDFGDLVVSPGLVDCHVHVNEPGRTEWEGFRTATLAAAAGGVTTLVDMPLNSLPVTTTRQAFRTKRDTLAGQCFVDVGFWGGVVPGNGRDLAELAEDGVLGCKAFLVHSGIDEFPNVVESDLRVAMPILREHGIPLLAHAELDLGAACPGQGPADPRAYRSYLASRPPEWEDAAIRLLVRLCRETGCPVHIVHLSSASSLPTLRAARAEGLPITVETCPHYLCIEAETIPDGATHYKCAPPIRDHENREALWQALFEGVIDFVISDHSPCIPTLKRLDTGDFEEAWGGIASLQLGLPLLWTEASRRGASLSDLANWTSTKPARFAGLSGCKGAISPGSDADLVLWAPDETFVVDAERLFFRHKVSPYLGRTLTGRVHRTFLRGTEIFDGVKHPKEPTGAPLLHRRNPT